MSGLTRKITHLRKLLKKLDSVVVCFSGGVDSSYLLAESVRVLGDRAVALTAVSPSLAPEEGLSAKNLARQLGARHVLVNTFELDDPRYAENPVNRCYFCKSELFELARDRAASLGLQWVADGTILDDLGDHRPGLKAASENEVRHPLVEAGLDKKMVRSIALDLGLKVWDKPSFACLGSRFAPGTRVTSDRVDQVMAVGSHLRTIGIRQFRARWHEIGDERMVRIEVASDELHLIAAPGVRDGIVDVCTAVGFKWVTVDLAGYGQ